MLNLLVFCKIEHMNKGLQPLNFKKNFYVFSQVSLRVVMSFFTRVISYKVIVLILFGLIGAKQVVSQEIKPELYNLTIKLRGVYDSKITITPYVKGKYKTSLKVIPGVTDSAKTDIPMNYLPGQFLLRMDYRKKKEDNPYPSEFVFFMDKHDLSIGINPLDTQPDSIDFYDDNENPAYNDFMQEDSQRRRQLALLEQLLGGYDAKDTKFYKIIINEFEKGRVKYNKWIGYQEEQCKDLFVSRLFAFQKVPPVNWNLSGKQLSIEQNLHYFDEINLKDTLLLRTQTFYDFVNNYMKLFGMMATSEHLRDSLFTEAGRIACEKASSGSPEMFGWMVDYFYRGYETYNITSGISMLQKFIDNPDCLTSKKQEILRRLEGMEKLVEGSTAPDFDAEMANGMKVHFDKISKDNTYGLIVFYDSSCGHCKEFLDALKKWYRKPENKAWFDVITIALDNKKEDWRNFYLRENYQWTDLWAPGGINSKVSKDYYILATPVMFILDKNRKILSLPDNIKDIEHFLGGE